MLRDPQVQWGQAGAPHGQLHEDVIKSREEATQREKRGPGVELGQG